MIRGRNSNQKPTRRMFGLKSEYLLVGELEVKSTGRYPGSTSGGGLRSPPQTRRLAQHQEGHRASCIERPHPGNRFPFWNHPKSSSSHHRQHFGSASILIMDQSNNGAHLGRRRGSCPTLLAVSRRESRALLFVNSRCQPPDHPRHRGLRVSSVPPCALCPLPLQLGFHSSFRHFVIPTLVIRREILRSRAASL